MLLSHKKYPPSSVGKTFTTGRCKVKGLDKYVYTLNLILAIYSKKYFYKKLINPQANKKTRISASFISSGLP